MRAVKCSFHKWYCPQSVSQAVVADSLRLHGLQPARLLCLWDSPSKRVLQWVAIPFSWGSSWPRDRTPVSCIGGRLFTIWATREAPWGGGEGGAFVLPSGNNPTLTKEFCFPCYEDHGDEGGGAGMGVHVLRSEAEKSIVTCFFKTVEVFNLKAQIGLHENCACDASSIVPGTLSRLFSFGWTNEQIDGWMGFDNFFSN